MNMRSHPFLFARLFTILILIFGTLAACTAVPATRKATDEPIAEPTLEVTNPPANAPTTEPTAEPTLEPTASVTTSETGHTLTLVWQSEFSPEAAVGAGVDVAVDERGFIYVTTANVKKYDPEGKFITQWGPLGTDEGEFNTPTGIAIGKDGNVYVDDFRNQRIQKFDSNGNFLLQWTTDPKGSPGSIAVDGAGNVYVSLFEGEDHRIQKFDSDGKLLLTWGDKGSGDGQFAGQIEDIAIDQDGNLYVTDSHNHRVQKFDSNGNFLAKFGGVRSQEGKGQFDDPLGIAVDNQGNIYVVDSHFLQKLDWQGNFIAQWPRTNDLDLAGFLTLDVEGNIYILARSNMTSTTGDTFNVLFVKKFHQSNGE
jgi:tripartite motif-containing protein 71